jgi:arginase family enzyme
MEMNNLGIDKIAREILTTIEPCDYIYVSFDVDSMDPTISRGTEHLHPTALLKNKQLLYCSA